METGAALLEALKLVGHALLEIHQQLAHVKKIEETVKR